MKQKTLFAIALVPFLALATSDRDATVVSRGNATLTFKDVDAVVGRLPEDKRATLMDNPVRIDNTLNTMLLARQLANEARANGLANDPAVMADVAWAADERLAAARGAQLDREIAAQTPDLEPLAKERYQSNKAAYATPDKRDVSHILITVKDNRSEADAIALAEKVHKLAVANPAKFTELVIEYSDDASKANNNGMIVDAGSSQYDVAFAEAARNLKAVGDISPVVKTQFGWHIEKLERVQPAKARSFADIKADLVQQLRTEYLLQKKRDYLDNLRNMKIEAEPATIASLRTRYGESGRNLARPEPKAETPVSK